MIRITFYIVFLLLVQAYSSSHAQTSTRTTHALLIGIADYSGSEGVSSLKAPPKDIALVRDVLKEKFKVPDKNITTLLDQQATHSAIKKAFAELAAGVKEGDFVYIHYSGHGSTRPDKNERGGYDQTWVTYGSRNKNFQDPDNRDVLDKEINLWLQPLYQKARAAENEKKALIDIVFVSDSCHSGTIARRIDKDGVTNVREVNPDPTPYPETAAVENSPSLPGIRIGAARDTESAIETCEDPNRCYGVFTWNWVNALKEATPGARWEEVFKRTFTLVTADRGRQRPQIEGHAERPIFGGEFEGPRFTVAVTNVDTTKGTIRLDAGAASGVTKGSLYRLYTAAKSSQGDVAELEVTDARQAFTSEAKLRKGSVQVGDLFTEVRHVYQFNPTRLYVSGDFPKDLNQPLIREIEGKAKDLSGFQLVSSRAQGDLLLYVLRPKKNAAGQYVYEQSARQRLPQSFRDQPPEVWVVTPQDQVLHDTMRIAFSDKDKGMGVLEKNLRAFAWTQQVRQLRAPGALPKVDVQVSVLRPDVTCSKDCFYAPSDTEHKTPHKKIVSSGLTNAHVVVKSGDAVSFSLKNGDIERSWYVYLVNITPDAQVRRVFPKEYANEDDALLQREERIDQSQKRWMRLNTPGVETYKLIVSSHPIDVRLLENENGFEKRADLNQLERLLRAAGRRRSEPEDIKVEDWGTLQADYEVLTQ